MTNEKLVTDVATFHRLTKEQARLIIKDVFGRVRNAVTMDGYCVVPQFGTFRTVRRRKRMILDLRTKVPMELPASFSVIFRAHRGFKAELTHGPVTFTP